MTFSSILLNELPLVIFTAVLSAVIGLSFVNATSCNNQRVKFARYFLALLAFALVASMLHLGNILKTPYMLLRLFGFEQNGQWVLSWLPLEIACVALLFVVGALYMYSKNELLKYALAFVGVLAIFGVTNAYSSMSATVPSWEFGVTFGLIASASVMLGGFAYSAFIEDAKVANGFSLVGFVLFVLALCYFTLHNSAIVLDGFESVFVLMGGYYGCFVLSSIVLCGVGLVMNGFLSGTVASKVAFVFALAGVMLSRSAFYNLVPSHYFLG